MNNLEKFLFKKISFWIVLILLIFSLFSYFVLNWLSVSGRVGFMKEIGLIPHYIKRVLTGVNSDLVLSPRFKDDGGITYGKNLDERDKEGYLLLPRYKKSRSIVELIDLKNGEIINTWEPNINVLIEDTKIPIELINLKRDRNQSRFMISNPLILDDGSLIFMHDSPLFKIDFCGKLIWKLDEYFHHSLNLDHNNNIWGLGRNYPSTIENDPKNLMDDTIQQVSSDGKLLYRKSIIKILQENNLDHLFVTNSGFDPIHANDVEVAKEDGIIWKKGDIFVSIKNLSLIILYRPSSNKVLWYSQGPWSYQHDVDIIDKNKITVFNNNLNISKTNVPHSNDVIFYNFINNKFSSPFKSSIKKFDIRTKGSGLSAILDNGDLFIEETNWGRILRISKSGKLKWQYINKDTDGNLLEVGWSRYLSDDKYGKLVRNLKQKKCQ